MSSSLGSSPEIFKAPDLIADRIIPASKNQQSEINNHQSEIQNLQSEILLVPAQTKRPLHAPPLARPDSPKDARLRDTRLKTRSSDSINAHWRQSDWIACSGVSMSADANDPRKALFILCLASSSLESLEEWIPDDEPNLNWFNQPQGELASRQHAFPDSFDQSPAWQAPEFQLDDGRTLVLETT